MCTLCKLNGRILLYSIEKKIKKIEINILKSKIKRLRITRQFWNFFHYEAVNIARSIMEDFDSRCLNPHSSGYEPDALDLLTN